MAPRGTADDGRLRLALDHQTAKLRPPTAMTSRWLRLALDHQTAKLKDHGDLWSKVLRLALDHQTAKLDTRWRANRN